MGSQLAVQVTVGVDGEPADWKPTVALPPAGSEPFHDSLVTVTEPPLPLRRPPHRLPIDCPDAEGHVSFQPVRACFAVTVTRPMYPAFHDSAVA